MPDGDALHYDLGNGYAVLAAGVTRDRGGRLAADVSLLNGATLYADRVALNLAEDRAAFASAATAADRPPASAIEAGLLALFADALTQVQEDRTPRRSQADALVELAADADLWHAPDGTAYATIPVGDHREHWPLGTKGFRHWLARLHYEREGKAPGGQAMQDALNVLAAQASYDGQEHPVFTRVAEQDGALYLDLGDAAWRVVEVTPTGWRVLDAAPVRFRRPKGMQLLPEPAPGGTVDDLLPFVNVASEDDWRLLIAWLVAALRATGPYPVLNLNGEQGSAKSTTARLLRALVDPNGTALRAEPRNGHDLVIGAINNWMLALDNLSRVPVWLSDGLCRLATGGGFATRELYSNDEETTFDAMRPVLLTGIDDLLTRGDLVDRAITITLPAIPEDKRQPEADFWRAFEDARPRILGALLTAVAGTLRDRATTRLARLPRMADFALWVTAAERTLEWEPGAFMAAYAGNRATANELPLEASPIVPHLRALAADGWQGSARALHAKLTEMADEATRKQQDWPKAPNSLTNVLRRLAPHLRVAGITVTMTRGNRGRVITLERTPETSSPSSRPAPAGDDASQDRRCGGDDPAGQDRHQSSRAPGSSPETTHESRRRDDGDDRDDHSRGHSQCPECGEPTDADGACRACSTRACLLCGGSTGDTGRRLCWLCDEEQHGDRAEPVGYALGG